MTIPVIHAERDLPLRNAAIDIRRTLLRLADIRMRIADVRAHMRVKALGELHVPAMRLLIADIRIPARHEAVADPIF